MLGRENRTGERSEGCCGGRREEEGDGGGEGRVGV